MNDNLTPITVKYDLIIKKILLPFFSIHSRILEKNHQFEIGPIKFLVAGTSPHKLGKVTTSTLIRCCETVSENSELESVEIIPTRRNQITSRTTFL